MCNKNKPTLQFIIDDMYVGNKPCIDFDMLSDKILLDSVIGLANDYCMTLNGCCTSSVLVHLDDLERVVTEDRACNDYEEALRAYLECGKGVCCNSFDNDDDNDTTSDNGNGGNTNSDNNGGSGNSTSDCNTGGGNNGGGNSDGNNHNEKPQNCSKLKKYLNKAKNKAANTSDNLSKANAQVTKDHQALTAAQAALAADPTNKQKQNAVTKASSALTKDLTTQLQAQNAYSAALAALAVAQKDFDDCNNN